jgi:hypothetical protein
MIMAALSADYPTLDSLWGNLWYAVSIDCCRSMFWPPTLTSADRARPVCAAEMHHIKQASFLALTSSPA